MPKFAVVQHSQLNWAKNTDLAGHALYAYDGIVVLPAGEYWELEAGSCYSVHRRGLSEDDDPYEWQFKI